MNNEGWSRKDVALAMRDLTIGELLHANDIQPFMAFKWAMNHTRIKSGTLLDVGCGVGQYGVLCERNYPDIAYTGTDINEFMIEEARRLSPSGIFEVCQFENNIFDEYDIILASGIIEITDDPPAMLDLLLGKMKHFAILNRIRLTYEESFNIEETTYCDCVGNFFVWNVNEIVNLIKKHASIVAWRDWDTQTTLVIEKEGRNLAPIYDGSTRKVVDYYIYRPYEIVYG